MTLLVVLVGGIVFQEMILRSGQTTILETRPIDPRDLFRGEYVILRYAIEDDELVQEVASEASKGESVYIVLKEDTRGIAHVSGASTARPNDTSQPWLRGTIGERGFVRFPSLEQAYVPEGAGLPVESMGSDLHVEVALKNGTARVVRLLDADLQPIDLGAVAREGQLPESNE